MSRIFRAVAGIFLCGMILIGGRVSAEPVDAMELFRETVYETSKLDTRIFHQDIFFVLPSLVGELDFIGGIDGRKFTVAGDFGFWMTSDNGEATEKEAPFYLTQDGDSMTFYFQSDKKWKKITAPTGAARIVDAFTTPTLQQMEDQIEMVKEVTVLSDTDSQRTFLVKIDGNKIAEEFLAELQKNEQQPNNVQNQFVRYFENGIRNADCWYTWTVNKNTWQTVTLSANLSGIVQSIAQEVLNDSETPWPAPIRDLVETVAYYSELRTYRTYLNPEAKSRLEIPKKVLKAKEVESVNAEFGSDKKK